MQLKTADIGKELVDLCNKGQNVEAMQKFYSPDIVSVEAFDMPPTPREIHGIDAVMKKTEWWVSNHVVHSGKAVGPFVSVDKFAVHFEYDVTFKPTGKRQAMVEVGLYTVAGDKIVREEFLYRMD